MQRRRSLEHDLQLLEWHRRDVAGIDLATQALLQLRWRAERPLHRHLLVEQHPDKERERVGVEEPVASGSPVM